MNTIRRSADKSLARPGRKQATANKLGIYSTYSPRSSIHFLARCFNFCKKERRGGGEEKNEKEKERKKKKKKERKEKRKKEKTRSLSVQPGLRDSNGLHIGWKMATFQLFFIQSREQVIVRRGQIRRIGWVIKTLEAQVGQFLLGCKWPVRRGIVVQEQDPLGELPAALLLQNVLQLLQQR